MSLPIVAVTEALDPVCLEWLAGRAGVEWLPIEDRAALLRSVANADGLVVRTYTQVDEVLLAAAPKLRVVGRGGVGLENIDLAACRKRGVSVVYTPDANTQAVVEYVFGALLEWMRPRLWLDSAPDPRTWTEMRATVVGRHQLSSLTLGIVGLGRIGCRVGQVAHALGMRVIGNDLLPKDEIMHRVSFPLEFASASKVYEEADILTLHVDARPSNRGLVGDEVLASLKPSCLLINTSRGMVVVAAALAAWAKLAALQDGGAILDVHDPEPFGADYPLLKLPNVKLGPHLASRTDEAMRNMSWVVRDVMEVLEGRRPRFPA